MTDDGFAISRFIHYRNSFRPLAVGKISPEGSGSVFEVVLRLRTLVAVGMTLWFCGIAVVAGIVLSAPTAPSLDRWIPVGMFFGAYVLMQGAFVLEARLVKKFFEKLVDPLRV